MQYAFPSPSQTRHIIRRRSYNLMADGSTLTLNAHVIDQSPRNSSLEELPQPQHGNIIQNIDDDDRQTRHIYYFQNCGTVNVNPSNVHKVNMENCGNNAPQVTCSYFPFLLLSLLSSLFYFLDCRSTMIGDKNDKSLNAQSYGAVFNGRWWATSHGTGWISPASFSSPNFDGLSSRWQDAYIVLRGLCRLVLLGRLGRCHVLFSTPRHKFASPLQCWRVNTIRIPTTTRRYTYYRLASFRILTMYFFFYPTLQLLQASIIPLTMYFFFILHVISLHCNPNLVVCTL